MSGPLIVVGSGIVARWLGVSKPTFVNWTNRYADTPQPDAVIIRPSGVEEWAWESSRRAEWEAWHAAWVARKLPGRRRYAPDVPT